MIDSTTPPPTLSSPLRFADQVVIVTGGSQGIGRATAIAFAREGAHVIINYHRSEQAAQETLATIRAAGGRGALFCADVADLAGCEALAAAAEAVGPVTVLVNNAAGFSRTHFLDVPIAEFDQVLGVNVRGVYYLSQIVARRMAARQRGSIIHISSILARLAVPTRSAYCASKGAIEALTRAMALDLADFGIRVNAVAPGLIETHAMLDGFPSQDMLADVRRHIPSKRFGHSDELAAAILFLASDEASYINGIILPVDSALSAREAGPVRA